MSVDGGSLVWRVCENKVTTPAIKCSDYKTKPECEAKSAECIYNASRSCSPRSAPVPTTQCVVIKIIPV